MNVSEIGEFGLIRSIIASLPRQDSGLLVGIGDDAAVWKSHPQPTIATADLLLEGIHFDLRLITWYELGWKALAANLSDIAAMGGVPSYALVALGIGPDMSVEAVQEIYRGMVGVGSRFGTCVAGGDVARSPGGVLVAVTVLGHALEVPAPKAKRGTCVLTRSAARPGDLVAVTGDVGSSRAGLATLQAGMQLKPDTETLLRLAHLKPCPRVKEGQALLRAGVRAAMDISDGTAGDLAKMCQASGVGARIWLDKLPVLSEVKASFPDLYQDFALYGGEDYELLFAAPASVVEKAAHLILEETGTAVTVIGEVTSESIGRVLLIDSTGAQRSAEAGGYDHFAATA